ncbi:cysteine proteinase [Rozella allomycis CSF55]|uniref:Cysteine proteinase n=1 Tax=Rozella allomycis (strain CSF55) TaxID=988480 RepID=A0A075ARW2_ROZAC|nr:Peptidase C19, ubiquitin-specific peptidase, DUSP domain-containing protein [Rozella allomycis CSF55]RKP19381.1 cysteine proteinase [Rozella allomycis CSF55]|eukprot:EPZ33011.1 Peptidase C19, ubiquitin-specific peptidase, DUSP domain-containing protein [Rozella allomycis CSF55]
MYLLVLHEITKDGDEEQVSLTKIKSLPTITVAFGEDKVTEIFNDFGKKGGLKLRFIFCKLLSWTSGSIDDKFLSCAKVYLKDKSSVSGIKLQELFNDISLKAEKSKGKSIKNIVSEWHLDVKQPSTLSSFKSLSSVNKIPKSSSFYDSYNIFLKGRVRSSSMERDSTKQTSKKSTQCSICMICHDFDSDIDDFVHEIFLENQNRVVNGELPVSCVISWIHQNPSKAKFLWNLQENANDFSLILEEKKAVKLCLKNARYRVGDPCYILSSRWWQCWCEYVQFYETSDDILNKETIFPGPIDNMEIIDYEYSIEPIEFYALKKELQEGLDFILIPENVWELFFLWYGGGPVMARQIFSIEKTEAFMDAPFKIKRNKIFNVEVELFPLLINIKQADGETSECIVSSISTLQDLINISCKYLNLDVSKRYLLSISKDGNTFFDFSIDHENPRTLGEIGLESGNIVMLTQQDEIADLEKSQPKVSLTDDKENIYHGIVGLENLGNTCYLNASLQSLINLSSFSNLFIKNLYASSMNVNKGRKFKILDEFGLLIKKVFHSVDGSCLAPQEFRNAVSKISIEFAGYAQHDAQEFLGALLDALHEDLNKNVAKSFVKNPDWKGENENMFASILWKNHLQRNNSILVPIFQGQLKSFTECNSCKKKSLNFDPFLFLSVPIPSILSRSFLITIINLESIVYQIKLTVNTQGTAADIIAAWKKMSIEDRKKEYLLAEINNGYVSNVIKRNRLIDNIRQSDNLVLYEYKIGITRVDSEFQFETNPSSTLKNKYGSSARIHFINRKYKTELFKSKGKFLPFGLPIIHFFTLLDDNTIPVKTIYDTILYRLSKLLNVFIPFNVKETSQTIIPCNSDPFQDGEIPFVLRFINIKGSQCRSCQDVNCTGCILGYNNDTFPLCWDDSFSIDWKNNKLAELVKFDNLKKPNINLNVNLSEDEVFLEDCLLKFQYPEKLLADEYFCSNCNTYSEATKKISIHRAPLVLIVHLNRFKQNMFNVSKNSKLVRYPFELVLENVIVGDSFDHPQNVKYELQSVICHVGDVSSGHYICVAKNTYRNNWYLFDDNYCGQVEDVQQIVCEEGYILLYQMVDCNRHLDKLVKEYFK